MNLNGVLSLDFGKTSSNGGELKYLMILWGGEDVLSSSLNIRHWISIAFVLVSAEKNVVETSSTDLQVHYSHRGWCRSQYNFISKEESLGNFKLESSSDQIHFCFTPTSKGHAKNSSVPKFFAAVSNPLARENRAENNFIVALKANSFMPIFFVLARKVWAKKVCKDEVERPRWGQMNKTAMMFWITTCAGFISDVRVGQTMSSELR